MRSLNLDQLRALEAVIETGGFTAAAQKLNLSQSAVSTQIRELEDRFGVQLVARIGKKAFATDAGREALDHARRIAERAHAVEAAARRYREGWLGRVRIAAHETICTHLLAPMLARLRASQPNLEIAITVGTSVESARLVLANDVDIAVVTMPFEESGLDLVPIYEEPLLAILPAQGRLPAEMTPQELGRHPLILDIAGGPLARMIHAWFAAGGVTVQPVMEMNADETSKTLVAAGFGASIRPSSSAHGPGPEGYTSRPLKPPLMWKLAMIQRHDKVADKALTIVREALAALGGKKSPARKVKAKAKMR